MMSRRAILTTASAAGLGGAVGAGFWSYRSMGSMEGYRAAMDRTRREIAVSADGKELVRYATLAANGHNAQPWQFLVAEEGIAILPDFRRSTPVVDPDDHHLLVSLGSAAENLVLAARARGQAGDVIYTENGGGAVQVRLSQATAAREELFAAIPKRPCTRSVYSGDPVPADDLLRLKSITAEKDSTVVFLTKRPLMEKLLELLIAANRKQMADPAFITELQSWIRFNPASALASGDGLFNAASGNPVAPSWIGEIAFPLAFSVEAETRKLVEQVRSSAGFAIFFAGREGKADWVRAGRLYQRFALQATALGIRNAMLNQPVELPEFRRQLAELAGMPDLRPDLVVRFGYAPLLPMSLRRSFVEIAV
jgi:hypothetical protein